jgi:hypothetical protein
LQGKEKKERDEQTKEKGETARSFPQDLMNIGLYHACRLGNN